jgi:hypothetical protein
VNREREGLRGMFPTGQVRFTVHRSPFTVHCLRF